MLFSIKLLYCPANLFVQIDAAGGSDALKTCVAFFCLLISAFLNFFLLTVIHDIVPREPLPDIVFMAVPQQRWAWSVGDVLSTLRLPFTLLMFISTVETLRKLR